MKYLILLSLFITGCGVKGVPYTIFLKENNRRFQNLQGADCMEDGYEIIQEEDGKHFTLITYYLNCEVHEYRQLEEFEIKNWPKPKWKINGNTNSPSVP